MSLTFSPRHALGFTQEYNRLVQTPLCCESRELPDGDMLHDRMSLVSYEEGLPDGVDGAVSSLVSSAIDVRIPLLSHLPEVRKIDRSSSPSVTGLSQDDRRFRHLVGPDSFASENRLGSYSPSTLPIRSLDLCSRWRVLSTAESSFFTRPSTFTWDPAGRRSVTRQATLDLRFQRPLRDSTSSTRSKWLNP